MFDDQTETAVSVVEGVALIRAGVDRLLEAECASALGQEIVDVLVALEVQKRRLAAVDHRLIGQLQVQGVAAEFCVPSTATLLRDLLRITPGKATARVRAADNTTFWSTRKADPPRSPTPASCAGSIIASSNAEAGPAS
jgi:Domain of unknown function (DUF222)